jgi:uncharacterized protein (TIGR00369 family)
MKTYPGAEASIKQNSRERNIQWEDPAASPDPAERLSGLEFLTAVLAGRLPPPPITTLMNLRLIDVSEGRVVIEGEAGEEHYNGIGMVHGGYAMTMLDTALSCAIQSTLPMGALYGTVDVHTRFLRPITRDTGTTRCEARLVSATRTLGTAEGAITDRDGRLLATATTACALRRPPE